MPEMYIEALHVKNVRLFPELDIQFNRHFNFLAGPNGCGKTSVLTCISHCFDTDHLTYSRFGEKAELWTDITMNDDRKYRLGFGSEFFTPHGYRENVLPRFVDPPQTEGRRAVSRHKILSTLEIAPLFIGTQRNIPYHQIQGIIRESSSQKALEEYLRSSTLSLYGMKLSKVKQWIVNRYFVIEKNWAAQEKQNWEHFISSLPKIAPFNSNFSYVATGRDFEPVFSLYGKKCYLEELSAGYQAVLSLIVGIFAWIEMTMEGDDRLAVNARGSVLIDEPDIHMHPEWQFTLRQGLIGLFPNLQFIVTTHSPHLLASAGPGEVIVMPKAYPEAAYSLSPREKAFSGWSTDQILTEIMGVESLENTEYAQLYASATEAYTEKNGEQLKRIIEKLEPLCHPDDPTITALKTRLASLIVSRSEGGPRT
jgi:energy-coupling factor transporter ATP-binding protein EcfA2